MADNEPKARVFEITSQEPYVTEAKIVQALGHKTIKEAVYILHDKDTYTEKTVDKERDRLYKAWQQLNKDPNKSELQALEVGYGIKDWEGFYKFKHQEKVGEKKTAHWHCYIRMDSPQKISTIAKWFDTSKQNVEIKSGAGAWADCLEYAVHDSENAKAEGKYGYDWSELHCSGITLDAVKELVKDKQIRRLKYGKDLTEKELLRMKVMNEGLTLKQAYEQYPLMYADDRTKLIELRTEFLAHKGYVPSTRYNFFIQGAGGIGKDTIGRGLARQFYPDKDDDEIFHIVKDIDVPFEGYDGQPVIIWEDVRSQTLIQKFGRDGVFRLFDINVTKGRYNIKYGSMPLTNSMNILTSTENYTSFLDNLAGEYVDKNGNKRKAEDKGQAYRRFPFIIPIQMDFMDILVQKAFLQGDTSYEEYMQYNHMRGNLARLMFNSKVMAIPEEQRKQIQQAIEKKFMNSAAGDLIKLVEDNKGLIDKSFTLANEVLEEMLNQIDDVSGVCIEEKTSPSCCEECTAYETCKDYEYTYNFCTQPFKNETQPK